MKYLIRETFRDNFQRQTAGVKARDDFETIAKEFGYKIIDIPILDIKVGKSHLIHFKALLQWKKYLPNFKSGDVLFIQMPIMGHSVLLPFLLDTFSHKICTHS